MATPEYGDWEAIWMGTEDTAIGDGWFPAEWDVKFNELSIFEKKLTYGRIDKDSDDIISSLIISDLTGGGQVDMMTGADQGRYTHGILDTRSPSVITLPQYVQEWSPGTGTVNTYPLGAIGDYPYILKNSTTPTVYAWNETTDASGNSVAATAGGTPTGKATKFNDKLFIPYGTYGYAYVGESSPGSPTWSGVLSGVTEGASPTATTNPTVVDFEVWDDRIWALTTTGALAYSYTGLTGAWAWDQSYNYATARFMKLETSQIPTKLITYADNNGDPTLYVLSNGVGYRVDFVAKAYEKTTIQFAPHPDFGKAACVWRPGEDLKIGVGLDVITYTAAGVVDPDTGLGRGTGLSRNDGMPYTHLGTISDLVDEMSALYALVTGTTTTSTSYFYSAQVGSSGSGNGQFNNVRGLVVDSAGNVWACDENNERIQKFNSTLVYQSQFGSVGTGNGQFASDNGPYDIDVDSANNLFVVDRGNSRIQKFNSAGTYQSQFGTFDDGTPAAGYVESWVFNSTYGSSGTGNDNFNGPSQIAVDSAGNTYTADGINNRLIKRNSSGAYVAQKTYGIISGICIDAGGTLYGTHATYGLISVASTTLATIIDSPETVSDGFNRCATDGISLYVTDTTTNQIKYYDCATLTYQGLWGGTGTANGQFNNPRGIATDGTYVYVVDVNNNRLQKFTLTGTYVTKWTLSANCAGVAITNTNQLLVSDEDGTVRRYNTTGTLIDSFSQAGATATATLGTTVWVVSYANDTLHKWNFTTTSTTPAVAPINGAFNLPESLAIKSSSGRIYVADTGNHRVQYFTSAGAYEGKFGSSAISADTGAIVAGVANGEFNAPSAIAVNESTGDVYVVDENNNRVCQFTATGTFQRAWGNTGSGNGQFTSPVSIAVNPVTGTVLVGDEDRDDIQEFTSSGVYLRRFGGTGSGNGLFNAVTGLAINAAGTLVYASDEVVERVQSFTLPAATSALNVLPSVHYWTGQGWHGAWEHTDDTVKLTWGTVTATSHAADGYRLWWGASDGKIYTMPLRRTFHNPRAGWQAGVDRFASTGYVISSRFDALMSGFYKKASRFVVFCDNATATERIRVRYRMDAETPWNEANDFLDSAGGITYVTTSGRTILEFAVDSAGFSWGERFNWIQFRFDFERRNAVAQDYYQTPVMTAAVLNFTKVPQQARTFVFTIPYPKSSWLDRTGVDIRDSLAALLRANQFVKLVHQDTTYRGQLAAVAGITSLGSNYSGGATVNFIEIPTQN